jgi:hypothetical protein
MPINWPWGKTKEIKCPDGTTRIVYKNIDEACPLVIPGWNAQMEAALNGASQLRGSVKARYEKTIRGFLFGLNEQNQSLMMSFRMVYQAYASNPCANGEFLTRETEKLLDEQRRIMTLKLQITAVIQLASTSPTETAQLANILSDIASRIGEPAVSKAACAEIASLEIAETRKVAEQIVRGGNQ